METIKLRALELFILRTAIGRARSENVEDAADAYDLYKWALFTDDEKASINYCRLDNDDEQFLNDIVLERLIGKRQRRLALHILLQQIGLFSNKVWPYTKGALLAVGWEPPIEKEDES